MHAIISINLNPHKNPEKPKKPSIIALPEDYTVIDVETTGLDPDFDTIIEVGALRVRSKKIVAEFSSLVKTTDYLLPFITQLTGITQEMLNGAPDPEEVFPAFRDFIGDDLLVGHNVQFDYSFLWAEYYNITQDFIDTLRLSRKLFPDIATHRLIDVAPACGVVIDEGHRSLADCKTTYKCFEYMRGLALEKFGSFEEFKKAFDKKRVDASKIKAQTEDFDEDHPFYHKTVVFTGALNGLLRKDAMQQVVNVGGYVGNTITKATNYLVMGTLDYSKTVSGDKSVKIIKAEKLILEGADLQIISENVFLDLMKTQE